MFVRVLKSRRPVHARLAKTTKKKITVNKPEIPTLNNLSTFECFTVFII